MMSEHWSGKVGGRPVAIRFDRDQSIIISTVLAENEDADDGGMVAARKKGAPIDLQPDDGETYEQVLMEAGFTGAQAAEIVSHIPTVLDAE